MLQKGSKGNEVLDLQKRLIMEGYNCGPSGADGDFGEGTYKAVIRFQQEVGLTPDGIVGNETWNALIAVTGDGNPFLVKRGDSGASVKALQEKLIARGYSCGSAGADGDFGEGTYNAVCNFQRDHGLDVDGMAGPKTLSVINGAASISTLRSGSKGALVKELQQKLIAKGYSCGSAGADGSFGQGTYNAVISFQAANGLDADGIVGPRTWDTLNGLQNNTLLRVGAKGSAVKELQQKLIAKGYSCGSYGADGAFGQGTYDAVVRFQGDHGLSVDGVVGPATWSALNSSYGNNYGSTLKMGSKGDSVRTLQLMLMGLGYSCGSYGADGSFGEGTYNAVIAFQKAHGLTQDGVVGSMTWGALYNSNNNGGMVPGKSGVSKFLKVAINELGTREQYNNITKYGAWYGNNGDYWCAQFVSWCASQAGILGSLVPCYQSCELGANWYRSKGRYKTRVSGYIPKPGDVIFFRRSDGFYRHTGIVEYVENNTVHTIEGNSSDCVRRVSYRMNYSEIHGYGYNGGIQVENTINVPSEKEKLYNKLSKLRDEHLSILQEIKSDRTMDDAFNAVWDNDERIFEVSKELKVPKEMMQAVIFREQICIGLEDSLADEMVKNGSRRDSSTGLGQIFAATAIEASNYIHNTSYDDDDIIDLNRMWWTLQGNHTNIYYVGLVLLFRARKFKIDLGMLNRGEIKQVIARYNGTGDAANKYGNQTILYYDAFREYTKNARG